VSRAKLRETVERFHPRGTGAARGTRGPGRGAARGPG
jgi:hypothetical protein